MDNSEILKEIDLLQNKINRLKKEMYETETEIIGYKEELRRRKEAEENNEFSPYLAEEI